MDYPISVPSIGLVGGKFIDEDPLAGTPGSLIPSVWGNSITDEVLNVITAAGLVPSEANLTQLLAAIRLISQKGQESFAVDTGVVNAYVCAFTPAITVRSESRPLRFKVKTSNTGASTLNDGVGPAPLVGLAHAALQGGELVADGEAWAQWNSTLGGGSYVLLFCSGAAQQVGPALQSQHAVQLTQAQALVAAGPPVQGTFKNLVVFTTGTNAQVGIFCEEGVLKDPAGKALTGHNLFATIDMTTAGLNGLDSGAVAASSWYSVWLISNGASFGAVAALIPTLSCNTTAGSAVVTGLASTALMRPGMPVSGGNVYAGSVIKSVDSPTQITLSRAAFVTNATTLKFQYDPVMPPGYTYKARASSLPTEAGANKFPMGIAQLDDVVALQLGVGNTLSTSVIAAGTQGNIAGTPAGWVAASLVTLLPPTASEVHGFAGNSIGSGTIVVAPNGLFGGVGSGVSTPWTVSGGAAAPMSVPFRFLLERFALMYASNVASATCNLLGWKDRL